MLFPPRRFQSPWLWLTSLTCSDRFLGHRRKADRLERPVCPAPCRPWRHSPDPGKQPDQLKPDRRFYRPPTGPANAQACSATLIGLMPRAIINTSSGWRFGQLRSGGARTRCFADPASFLGKIKEDRLKSLKGDNHAPDRGHAGIILPGSRHGPLRMPNMVATDLLCFLP